MAHQQLSLGSHKLLHIEAEEAVSEEFIDFPERADGDGKAEGKQAHKQGTEVHGHMPVPVEDGHHHEAEEARHHGAEKVQYGVPPGEQIVEAPDLAQENGAVEKDNIEAVQQARQLKPQPPFQNAGQVDGDKAQNALHQHQQVVRIRMVARLVAAATAENQPQDQIDNGHQKAQVYPEIQDPSQSVFLFYLLPPILSTAVFPIFRIF